MTAEEIVRTYSDMIYGVAMRYVRNEADADDVFNDVFYRYFRRERSFQSEDHRKYWLLRVTVNSAKEFLINKKYEDEINDDMFGDVTLSGSGVSVEELMDLRAALTKLREEYREVIELYYLNGFNTREIAMMLQKPENTVKSHLSRARGELKELLS